MRVDHRTKAWTCVLLLLTTVLPHLPYGGAVAADFDSIEFKVVSPTHPQSGSGFLKILADGTCTYRNGREAKGVRGPEQQPPKTYTHTLSNARMAHLTSLLAPTKWLRTPFVIGSHSFHDPTITITLKVGKEVRKVSGWGDPLQPYDRLLWFHGMLWAQEMALYELQRGSRSRRVQVCSDLAGRIRGLCRAPNRSVSPFERDYRRYVGEMRKILAEAERSRDGMGYQLIAAIETLSYVGDEESFEKIARLTSDKNQYVRRAAIDALARIRRPEFVPYLVGEMKGPRSTEYAAWPLIRMGDVAVPAIAKVLAANDGELAHWLVRAYITHWDELAAPLDQRIVDALRAGISKRGDFYGGYYGYVLDLAELRPITAAPKLGTANGAGVVRHEESTFLHGWYICRSGKIVQHGAAPKTDPSTRRFYLTPFKAETRGSTLRFFYGWRDAGGEPWRPGPRVEYSDVPVPENSVVKVDYVSGRRKKIPGAGNMKGALRITPEYHLIWQGRVVSEGKDVLTLAYVGRLARPTDPVQKFMPPREPLAYKAPPKFRHQ